MDFYFYIYEVILWNFQFPLKALDTRGIIAKDQYPHSLLLSILSIVL